MSRWWSIIFHVAQLTNHTLTEVRRRDTVQIRGRRGHKGNREWESRDRLARSASRRTCSASSPRPAATPDRTEISRRRIRFYEACAATGLPELERRATTVSTWWPEILATELRTLGAEISAALCVIDRQQGGTETVAAEGIKLLSLLTADDLRSATGRWQARRPNPGQL